MAGQLNQRYDEVTYLTTHNSFANKNSDWTFAQQTFTIAEQLELGVRALMLDLHEYNDDIHLCHGGCEPLINRLQNRGDRVTLREVLQDIKLFLNENPEDVVTLLMESRVSNRPRLWQQFEASETVDLLFYADRLNSTTQASWDVEHQGWPELAWMVEHNKRLVVFSDHKTGNDGLPYLWNYSVENCFGDDGLYDESKWTEARPESSPLDDDTKSLMLLNYFPTFDLLGGVIPDAGRYDSINNYYRVLTQIYDCHRVSRRLPNFISFDYFEHGKNGGPIRAVRKLNRERGNQSPRYREHPVLWQVNQKYDTGTRPAITTHPDGTIIDVHQSQYEPTLWYRTGEVHQQKIMWSDSHNYTPGQRPAVTVHLDGWVISVYESERGESLHYMVGQLIQGQIEWGQAHKYDNGVSPDVAVHPDGWIIEVHQSENHETLWYHIGMIDGERIRWTESRQYDTGIQPAVAVHPSGRIIEVHQSENHDALWYHIGTLGQKGIDWTESVEYNTGKRPNVGIHPDGYVLETHESAHGDSVWYHIGKLVGPAVEWGGAFRFDAGETPAITAANDGRVVAVLNREKMWYKGKLWYHVGALR